MRHKYCILVSIIFFCLMISPQSASSDANHENMDWVPSDYKCPKSDELEEIEIWLEHASDLQRVGVDPEETERFTNKAKEVAEEYGRKLSKRNFCSANEKEIFCAMRVVRLIQATGGKAGASELIEWVKNAFKVFAADVTTLTGPDTRKKLAKQARQLGLLEVETAIKSEKEVQSDCVLDWRVDADFSYQSKMEGFNCQWKLSATFSKVKFTGWRSSLGGYLPGLSSLHEWVRGSLNKISHSYFDGGEWVECDISDHLILQASIEMTEELQLLRTGGAEKIPMTVGIHPMRSNTSSKCKDGVSSPLCGKELIKRPWMIPVKKIADGKPFTKSFTVNDSDGILKVDFRFAPAK